jgi:biotin operon repressor
MPTPPLPDELARLVGEAFLKYGRSEGARRLGLPRSTFDSRLDVAIVRGFVDPKRRTGGFAAPAVHVDKIIEQRARIDALRDEPAEDASPAPADDELDEIDAAVDLARLRGALRRDAHSLDQLAEKLAATRGQVLDAIDTLRADGANVHEFSGKYQIIAAPAPQAPDRIPVYTSRPDGSYAFGFTSDNHLCSKYARLDVLNSLYDHFAEAGVDRVFNAGNWIDGEARFNKHDLLVHGLHEQVAYLAREYPQRPGIVTYAVAGDDHEGWYAQREGVDIGRYTANAMRDAGRSDWVDLGYMEAYVRLQHAASGAGTMLHVMHPGGGTAYALSYTQQKIAESYDGGDKPAVNLIGHYHKLVYALIRNVHSIQTGCTQDQTPFMRKKKIPAHVGGGICRLTQNAETGAIESCSVQFFNYFVRDYYNHRWSHASDVTLPARS